MTAASLRGLTVRGARTLDWLLAGAILPGGIVDVSAVAGRDGPLALAVLGVVLWAAAVLERRRAPLRAAMILLVGVAVVAPLFDAPEDLTSPFFALLLVSYAAGAHGSGRSGALVPWLFAATIPPIFAVDGEITFVDAVFPSIFIFAAWLGGRAVRSRTHLAAELHEAAVLAREEEEADAARAVAEERRRIAREMHDVVAHSISVMVVQAGGARRILDREPDRAVRAAEQIERTGREALVEMRRLLGLLQPAEARGVRGPQPTLEALDGLVSRAREAGLPVEVREEGERRPLPTGLDLTAYRIVQEALTNALKHAGAAPTAVTVRWSEDELELEIVDSGRAAPSAGPTTGHGLVGMQERVRLYGGRLHTGPRREGGFEVRAQLPLCQATDDMEVPAWQSAS